MIRLLSLALFALSACSPALELPGCVEEQPEALGRSCEGDGECGSWLVCDASRCALPPAVSGEGGTTARIVADETTELRVEVARGDLQRARGLGARPCIEDGWGLVIEYPTAGDHLITTETMRFPLDLAMAGPDGVIHTVHRDAAPGGEALYGSEPPIAFVLETEAGAIDLTTDARFEYD